MDLFAPKQTSAEGVLFICTGNICRSAFAESLLRNARPDLRVESAGLHAVVGAPMDRIPAELATRSGGETVDHKGRQLSASIVADAGLILTMTRDHRGGVLAEFPFALHRTFTIAEFADLLAMEDAPYGRNASGLRDAVARVGRIRSSRVDQDQDDIEDPYHRPREVHERVAQKIRGYVHLLASHL